MKAVHVCSLVLVVFAVLWCSAQPVAAGVRRDDVDDIEHTGLADKSVYAAVGQVTLVNGDGGIVGLGSGTHIGDGWILTAAHVVDDLSPGHFIVGPFGEGSGESISSGDIHAADTSEVYVHPSWNSSNLLGGNDVAVFKLQDESAYENLAAATLAPVGTQPVGQSGTAVGYGRTGVGSTGWTSGSAGTKRAGTNMIDLRGGEEGEPQDGGVYVDASGVATSILLSDFDNPENSNASLLGDQTPLDLEYSIAPGDSGGAMMIVDPSDPDNVLLAGIHSFGASLKVDTGDIIVGDEDGFVNSSYGELQGYTEVSPFIADFIFPTTGIPEPRRCCCWRQWAGCCCDAERPGGKPETFTARPLPSPSVTGCMEHNTSIARTTCWYVALSMRSELSVSRESSRQAVWVPPLRMAREYTVQDSNLGPAD